MMRSRDGSAEVMDRMLRTNTVVTQWEQDLRAVVETGVVPALGFNGQTLTLTRRSEDGVRVVAWSLRGGTWQRWVGPPVTTVAELTEGWFRSLQLQGSEPGHLALAENVSDWQVFYFRGNAWTNAQSTGDLVAPGQIPGGSDMSMEVLPDGVRLVIGLPEGTLTRDIAMEPGG
jgi:general secretion pathway protein J